MAGNPGCRLARTENPRVGGSIPPLATIQIMWGLKTQVTAWRSSLGAVRKGSEGRHLSRLIKTHVPLDPSPVLDRPSQDSFSGASAMAQQELRQPMPGTQLILL